MDAIAKQSKATQRNAMQCNAMQRKTKYQIVYTIGMGIYAS